MITEFAKYNEPKMGDWVIIDPSSCKEEYNDMLLNSVGEIAKISNGYQHNTYHIRFYGTSNVYGIEEMLGNFNVWKENIIGCYSSKEEAELALQSKKYNI